MAIEGQQVAVASVRDVSERRRREEAIRSLYEIISDRELGFEEKVDALMRFGRRTLGTGFATLSRLEGDEYVFDHVQSPEGEVEPGDTVSIEETICEGALARQQRLVVDDVLEAHERTQGATLEPACHVGAPCTSTARFTAPSASTASRPTRAGSRSGRSPWSTW